MILLTDAEKKRFLEYLEVEEFAARGLVEQMKKIGAPQAFIAQNNVLALACRVLIDRLSSGERISTGDSG